MSNPFSQSVPPALGYTNFLRYAPSIGKALRSYPLAISEHVTGSPATFAVGARNARAGKRRFGYSSPDIDEALFAEHADKLGFFLDVGFVHIGTKDAVAKLKFTTNELNKDVNNIVLPNEVEFRGTIPESLHFLCTLLSRKEFNPTPSFVVSATEDEITLYTSTLDVEFIPTSKEGFYRVI